ncbi:GNAT family N-acetyltransferase [Staphylococcus canis]|uniref:GNAT family N-acetyltransferase n=1 Tax=Staphylococcus canis TaxID=2724942 RepID=A0ABS0T857_9STAP|nr:GNAT family N-acetyltransferase [Staphylococcus canis]MBI5974617.1 GNAT family N-acetyltransferase [Staphylococcus canis]
MVAMADIYVDSQYIEMNERYTVHQTPSHPLSYDGNKWMYHQMPDVLTFQNDMISQEAAHRKYGASHLQFDFPENIKPNVEMMRFLRGKDFQLGCVELYKIAGKDLQHLTHQSITLKRMTNATISDYFSIFNPMSLEFGEDYVQSTNDHMLQNIERHTNIHYYTAYEHEQPVGIVNLIETDQTVEIDGFAVKPEFQRQGIGTRMQAAIGKIAGSRNVILVADSEDTVKTMYQNQGYDYISFRYSALLSL